MRFLLLAFMSACILSSTFARDIKEEAAAAGNYPARPESVNIFERTGLPATAQFGNAVNMMVAELPSDLPVPIVDTLNHPSPGGIFLAPFGPAASSDTAKYKNYLMILDTACNVVSYKLLPYPAGYVGYHFKEEPNGLLSYMVRQLDGIINVTDTSYNVITTFNDTTNPYKRIKYFAHFDLLPNGHYLDVRYDFQYADLSRYFAKGEPNGAVLQAVVQELDKDRKVIFQWRSLDYVPVFETYDNVTPAIDYFHPNSMVLSNDGNLLLSGRDIGSILKLDRQTGDIIWRLGGKKNEFTFIGEHESNAPTYFSYQHDIRQNPDGNITLFDNGRQHNPQYSRGVEYKLDESKKTATMVWEYRHTPDYFADQHGSTQRMPNGNTLIAWGTYSMNGGTAVTELHPDNTKALEFHFPSGLESQFIYKYPWPACPLIASVTQKEMLELNTYDFNNDSNKTGVSMTFNKLSAFTYNSLKVDRYDCSPMDPEFSGRAPIASPYRIVLNPADIYTMKADLNISLSEYPMVFQPGKTLVYIRETEGKGTFRPLPTTYDAEKNQLTAKLDTTKGELIFAYPDSAVIARSPIVFEPVNNARPNQNLPVRFSWNPRGYFTGSVLQIAPDSTFSSMVLDTALSYINLSWNKYTKDQKYFWRVRSVNEAGPGAWSQTRSFTMSDPYLALTNPIGGEIWSKDSARQVIRWDYNVPDSANAIFKVELYRDGKFFMLLRDSLFSAVNAVSWVIPKTVPNDTNYQVKVTSVKDTSIHGISPNYFTITGTTSVEDEQAAVSSMDVNTYPNPVTANTVSFDISSRIGGTATLKVYSMEGKEVATLMNSYLGAGNYRLNWTSEKINAGMYFYVLKIGTESKTGKMVVIK